MDFPASAKRGPEKETVEPGAVTVKRAREQGGELRGHEKLDGAELEL